MIPSETTVPGRATGGKPINLHQFQEEINQAGVETPSGLGFMLDQVYTYDVDGAAVDFATADQATVDQAIANHVAMRDKTDQELAAEFQATSDPVRKQDIRDQQAGLIPREQVPM